MNTEVAVLVAQLNMAVDTLAGLDALQAALQQEMDRLAQDKFATVPTELWEDRQGKGRYLRLQFRQDGNGQRQRIYVGCDPAKIAEAQQTMTNTQRWIELQGERERIAGRTRHLLRALQEAASQAATLRSQYLPAREDGLTAPVMVPETAPLPQPNLSPQAVRSVAKLVTLRALLRLLPDDAGILPWFYHLQNAVECGVQRSMQAGAVAEILTLEHWAHLVGDTVALTPLPYDALHQTLQESLRELLASHMPVEEVAA